MPTVKASYFDLAELSTVVRSPTPLRLSAPRPVDQGRPNTASLRLMNRVTWTVLEWVKVANTERFVTSSRS